MSRDDNRKMISAYEKMLQDGTAFKEVDTSMVTEPDLSVATGKINDNPLGDPINDSINNRGSNIIEDNGYGEFDSLMEKKMHELRMSGKKHSSNEFINLKKRVKRLEEAMTLVMDSQTKLIEGR